MSLHRFLLGLAVCPLLLAMSGNDAAAGVLTSHALVDARATIIFQQPSAYVRTEDNVFATTGLITDRYDHPPNAPSFATAQATAGSSATSLLRAGAGVSTDVRDTVAHGIAGWRDIAFVSGPELPDFLRMTFRVEGSVSVAWNPGDSEFSETKLGVTAASTPLDFQFFNTGTDPIISHFPPDSTYEATYSAVNTGGTTETIGFSESGPWDSTTKAPIADGMNFIGEFHIDTPYDSLLGGYGWTVILDAFSHTSNLATASVSSLRSLGLQSVTLIDGTPIEVSFDSGLQIGAAAVPEPSSVVLFGLGTTALLAFGRMHRMRA